MKRLRVALCFLLDHKRCRKHTAECPTSFHCVRCGLGQKPVETPQPIFGEVAVDQAGQIAIAPVAMQVPIKGKRIYTFRALFNPTKVTKPFRNWKQRKRK